MDAVELVPGDVVELQDGDLVPADIRVFETAELKASVALGLIAKSKQCNLTVVGAM